jgi:hypothetical protein
VEADVVRIMSEAIEKASNKRIEVWVFFDEVRQILPLLALLLLCRDSAVSFRFSLCQLNTSSRCVGQFKEIICDRKMNGD